MNMATKRNTADTRLVKNSVASRGEHPAAAQDAARVNDEGTNLNLEQRLAMLRDEFTQEALPRVPDIPGYHMCWLSTTHSYDPIQRRIRLGYQLVKQSELKGFEHMKASSGEYEGLIMCNEMILAKLPLEIYQMIMKEFHHDQPLREEEAIHEAIKEHEAKATDSKGKPLTQREDGFEENNLVQRRPVPTFG
jgi:hypothetical protein